MHEFSSISVSSYDAGALSDRLTEQSREGWSVVAIVPTASSVTAYLSRAVDADSTEGTEPADTGHAAAFTSVAADDAADQPAATSFTAHDGGPIADHTDDMVSADDDTSDDHDADHHDEPADDHDADHTDDHTDDHDAGGASDTSTGDEAEAAEPADDAPGWGASGADSIAAAAAALPEVDHITPQGAGSIDEAAAALPDVDHITPQGADSIEAAAAALPEVGGTDTIGSTGSIEEAAAALPEVGGTETATSVGATADAAAQTTSSAATDAAAAASAAPAGWYADPSSRFELRYWDGSQWTEHVSRSGQQYTDPPVA